MNITLAPFPAATSPADAGPATPSLRAALAGLLHGAGSLPERGRFLAAASDHADLERRMRAWDEHERILRSLPSAL